MKLAPLLLSLALLTGCSPAAVVTPAPTPTVSATPSVSPTPSPSVQELAVGDKATLAAGAVSVQVLQLKPGKVADRDAPTIIALIRTCNVSNPDPIGPGWEPWSIVDADDGQFLASTESYDGDPTPAYPFFAGERALQVGDCAKGWVVFEVRKGSKPATIEYDNEAGDHLEWTA